MPNWCSNLWKVVGESTDLIKIYNVLEELNNQQSPLVPNEFGKLWFGCLIAKLGGNLENFSCKGAIEYYEWNDLEHHVLGIDSYSDSQEPSEIRKFLLEKFPNIIIIYQSEENNSEYYVSNDRNSSYFDKYLFKSEHETSYFETLEEACDYVKNLTGKEVKTVNDIKLVIEKYVDEHPEEVECANFYEFEIIED